jgi:cell wall-associated NlpC family hydrolase
MHTIKIPLAPLLREPDAHAALDTELLYGERVAVMETRGEWSGIRNETDGYIGWTPSANLGEDTERSHVVSAMGSFMYAQPDLKSAATGPLPFLSRVTVIDEKGDYACIAPGRERIWLHKATLSPVGAVIAHDPVEVARRFLGVPYKWGGRSPAGLDCAALVQLSFAACGIALPRDSTPQREFLKKDKPFDAIAAGDLIYTPGHVMLATSPTTVIHANATFMRVTEEKLHDVLNRYPLNGEQTRVVKSLQ